MDCRRRLNEFLVDICEENAVDRGHDEVTTK